MLAIFGLVLPGFSFGQAPASDPAKAAAQPPPVAAPAPAKGADDENDAPKEERFIDPNAKKTLAIFKPLTYVGPPIRIAGAPNDLTRVQNMAARVQNFEPDFVKRYVEYFAVELSKRDNINALINAPPGMAPARARGLEVAVDALTRPLIDGKANTNPTFLTDYNKILFESSLPKLLDNNFLSRIDAMIVLGMAGGTTKEALDLYAAQLKIPDQIIWVKMWAARGFTNAAQSGKANIDAYRAITGADALVTFLNSDPKLPYFAQFRAFEALGSIRVATAKRPDLTLDAASVAAGFLGDPKARLETRAYAAWALGMMRVAPQIVPYNFRLAGSEIGELATTLGTKIVAEYDEHPDTFDRDSDQARNLAALLMFQVVPSLSGEENPNDSGLLRSTHPSAAEAKPFLTKLEEKVKAVSREAYELLRAGGVAQKVRRNDLAAKVADLKTFLDQDQNKPKSRQLVPNGPVLP